MGERRSVGELVPSNPADYADFVVAAARRYPTVRFWIIWGEPTRAGNFFPIPSRTKPSARLSQAAIRTVRSYAQILDASYAALKGVSKRKIVIGGNSFTTGDISPLNWIRYMRLPNGRRPRMDLYGHNPFSARRPRLSERAAVRGYADFSDLDDLAHGWTASTVGTHAGSRCASGLANGVCRPTTGATSSASGRHGECRRRGCELLFASPAHGLASSPSTGSPSTTNPTPGW